MPIPIIQHTWQYNPWFSTAIRDSNINNIKPFNVGECFQNHCQPEQCHYRVNVTRRIKEDTLSLGTIGSQVKVFQLLGHEKNWLWWPLKSPRNSFNLATKNPPRDFLFSYEYFKHKFVLLFLIKNYRIPLPMLKPMNHILWWNKP